VHAHARSGRGSPNAQAVAWDGAHGRRVPFRALLISVAALAIPLFATPLAGESLQEYEILLWLPALVPAFLLTYYRGWGGASLALAAAMATLAMAQVGLSLFRAQPPDWQILLIVVLVWVGVSLGIGWFGELLHRARRQAEAEAFRDPLTGLPNRGHLRVFLDTAFGAAERGGSMVVVLFDLDHFKQVNDTHGHAAGDRTLVAFGEILATLTRRSDLSARFGGEEFVSVLTGSGGVAGAAVFAERVREALKALDLPWGPVTTSIGIASYSTDMTSPDLLLAEADRALYQAKEAGRDRVEIARGSGPAVDVAPRDRRAPVAGPVVDGRREPSTEVPGVSRERVGEPRAEAPSPRSSPLKGARVLVVTDDGIVGEGLSSILARAGYRTQVVADGIEALKRSEGRSPPHLILSEVVMPSMGGLTLADRLREKRPEVRVLLMSGYEHESLVQALPDGRVTFVKKPMTPDALVEAVRAALSSSGLTPV
jgi:diguanylate cyclase (GGDEF)-like protein